MDADLHNPEDLPRLYKACAECGGVAIGSRYCDGISVVNWPIGRILMSYFASIYVKTVLGMKIHDCTAGFKCYSRKALETIDLDDVRMKELRIPDRDEVHGLETGIRAGGGPDHIREPQTWHVQDERRNLRRGVLGCHPPEIQKVSS